MGGTTVDSEEGRGRNGSSFGPPVMHVSAPCGSGKTHAACRFIAQRIAAPACTESFVYVAPSKRLLEQTQLELERLGISVAVLTSDTRPNKVIREILGYMQQFTEGRQVLLICHNAYFGLPYFPQHGGWRVIIDEIPQLDTFFSVTEPADVATITRHMEWGSSVNDRMAQLRVRGRSRLKRFLTEVDDKTCAVKKLLWDALSANKDIFVERSSWQSLLENPQLANDQPLNLLSLLNERAFEGSILMGAHVENTLVGAMLRNKGARFLQHSQIARQLRYESYPAAMAERLAIQYVLDGRAWSKTLRDSIGRSKCTVMEEAENVILEALGQTPYLLAANNDYTGRLSQESGCYRLPVIAHGLELLPVR